MGAVPFYLDANSATHQANTVANTAAGLRLVALTMWNNAGATQYSAAWVPNDGRAWKCIQDATETQLLAFYGAWQAQGYEMKMLASTETLFAAVMEATQTGTQFVYDLTDGSASFSQTPTQPAWATTLGAPAVPDGSSGLTWTLVSIGAPPAWAPGQFYKKGAVITDVNGNLQQATTAGTSGSGALPWATTLGAVTKPDGTTGLTWTLVSIGTPSNWAARRFYAQGSLVKDNNGNIEQAATAGTSGGGPMWATAPGTPAVSDGNTGLAWTFVSASPPAAWKATQMYAKGDVVTDSNGNLQQAATPGTSGAHAPSWAATFGMPPVSDGTSGLKWTLISLGLPPGWNVNNGASQGYAQGALITDSNGNIQRATTSPTLNNAFNNNYQQPYCNMAPRAMAIYRAAGTTRRYALVLEPCEENWAARQWDTDAVTTQVISAYFNDLRYRPTLITYAPEGLVVSVFRDNSIGTNNWTAGNNLSKLEMTAINNTFTDRGLWPFSLGVNPTTDTFACVMVTTETPLARQFSKSGSDMSGPASSNLSSKLDSQVQNFMQSGPWNSVGKPPSNLDRRRVSAEADVCQSVYLGRSDLPSCETNQQFPVGQLQQANYQHSHWQAAARQHFDRNVYGPNAQSEPDSRWRSISGWVQ